MGPAVDGLRRSARGEGLAARVRPRECGDAEWGGDGSEQSRGLDLHQAPDRKLRQECRLCTARSPTHKWFVDVVPLMFAKGSQSRFTSVR